MFYDAASQIVQQTAIVLAGYVAEYHAGSFHCVHEEIGEVEDLLDRYKKLKADGFSELLDCQAWLRRVADLLPRLWD